MRPGTTIECAPDAGEGNSLFTNCGALTRWIEADVERLNFSCRGNVCQITARDPAKWVPNVAKVWCVGGVRISYDGPRIYAQRKHIRETMYLRLNKYIF